MKKTQKRLLGAAGLALVAGMTIVAAQLPSQDAAAVANSITDTLQVRVIGDKADVKFTSPASNLLDNYNSRQTIAWQYENADPVKVSLVYKNLSGVETAYTIADLTPDYYPGSGSKELELSDYGYGSFTFTITGQDASGASVAESSVAINYLPPTYDLVFEEDGDVKVDFRYGDDLYREGDTGSIVTSLYEGYPQASGTDPIWTSTEPTGAKETTIPKKKSDGEDLLVAGKTYTILVSYYKNDALVWQEPVEYVVPVTPDTGAPDTGGLFQNLNISREDYLVTGLLIFGVFAIVGFGIVFRSHKSRATSGKRRK